MLRDPTCVAHAEDLQAGSSYNIPANTQQAFGTLRAADEIIDEGHFMGKALGEAMNGYRPIVELMNANFGIYGMAELSSAGNTYATTGGQFQMPMTVIGAGGTAPNQSLGAEHSQPFHAYIMGIPGLKICSASKPQEAYGLAKSMIRDNGPGVLLLPVKMMKSRGPVTPDSFLPLHKSTVHHLASDESVKNDKAVTIVTYLHGVKETEEAIAELNTKGIDADFIELTCMKPVDWKTIQTSLQRTHKLVILDESTRTGGVGATVSAFVGENLFDELDAPVMRLCMEDAPVPYASEMEKTVVKRAADVVTAVTYMIDRQA
jgi:pyruvate/2-oxoglutarate/acetoin dehydrogenase E1 component